MIVKHDHVVLAATLGLSLLVPSPVAPQKLSPLSGSEEPGAFEQHLRRRYNNPLFPPDRRIVTQADIDSARLRDKRDLEDMEGEFPRFINDVERLPGKIDSSQVNPLLERHNALIERAIAIGSPAIRLAHRMLLLRQTLVQSWRAALEGQPEALRALDEAEAYWTSNSPIFQAPFIAQMNRKDGPIPPADVLPALLTESPETIATVMS